MKYTVPGPTNTLVTIAFAAIAVLALPALSAGGSDATSTSHDAHSAFEALKAMEGTWVGTVQTNRSDEPRETKITFKVSAGGHSVIQTFAPGSPMEMFSVYHMDGDELLMTHYCAIGNAPKMKFAASDEAGVVAFDFNGGTNMDPAKDAHAHEGTMRLLSPDRYESRSVGFADGEPSLVQNFKMERIAVD